MVTDITNTKIGQTGPVTRHGPKTNIFAFSSTEIENLKSKIAQYKQPHDQITQVRPIKTYEDLATRKDIETVSYKNPKPVELPGQQKDIAQVSYEPSYKIQPGLTNSLNVIGLLAPDYIKDLANAAIKEQQNLNGVA